eukprot:378512_1
MSALLILLISVSVWCTQSLVKMNPKGWMGQLTQTTRINKINIPGTHESMATRGGKWAKCVDYTILEQLNMGYRFFDIRTKWKNNEIGIYHGSEYMKTTWTDLHTAAKTFLNGDGKTECILLKVKNINGKTDDKFATEFAKAITAYNADGENNNDIYWFNRRGGNAPTIEYCKKKVVILADGGWKNKKAWTDLNPVRWTDKNFGKGDDSITWTPHHKSVTDPRGRFMKWTVALRKTIRAGKPRNRK